MSGERWSRGRARTVNRGDGGSIPPPFRYLGNFVHLTLPVFFGRDTKSLWSLLSGVYAGGSKRSHIGGKCVTVVCKWKSVVATGRINDLLCNTVAAGVMN